MNEIESRLRSAGGVLVRAQNADVAGTLDRWLRTGRLSAIHHGVYCRPEHFNDLDVRIRAAVAWAGPTCVVTGLSAARLTFWPSSVPDDITLAQPTTCRRARPGIRFERRSVPPELVLRRGSVAITHPCLTAVDLAAADEGGAVIDQVLRARAATLPQMWEALRLTPNRRGNERRRQLLEDSRTEPWSEAEREAHRQLRRAGITGWVANARVLDYYVDILFRSERLVLEIDGWEAHGTRQAFEDDRKRRNRLQLAGYVVLNFTWRQLLDEPNWLMGCVREALGR